MLRKRFAHFFNTVTNNNKILFLLFWCIIGLLTLPAYKAGYNADFAGLLYYFHHYNFADFINSEYFSIKSLYQVTQFQLFSFIYLFGIQPVPWFLLLTGLHALNGTLIFSFCKRLFIDFKVPDAVLIALAGALLFVINPNVTEVTIWKGGYHYLTGLLSQLLILIWVQKFLCGGPKKYVVYAALLFLISIFTLEIFYLTPWFCLLLVLGYYWKNLIDQQVFYKVIRFVFVPQLLLFLVHLVCFRLRFGGWVAHYGTTGDFYFSAADLFPKLPKYLVTLVGFAGHLPSSMANPVYALMDKPLVYYSCYLFVFLFILFIFIRFKKMPPAAQAASVLFGMMMLCMAIIAPMFFDVYNNRRCYELSFPVYMLMSMGIFTIILRQGTVRLIFMVYAGICVLLSVQKSMDWRNADKIQRGILRNYKWQNDSNVLILNLPSYYRDIHVIATSKWDELHENLFIFGYDTTKGTNQYISSYNMNHSWDGAHVVLQDSVTLKVTLNQWGSWWMYDLKGAKDFENDTYRLEMKDVGHEYILHLKRPAKEFIILYQQGEQWRVVDTNKSPGEEQW